MGKFDEKEVERMEKNMLKQQKENPVSVDSNDNQTPTESKATESIVDNYKDLWIDEEDSDADENFASNSIPKKKKVIQNRVNLSNSAKECMRSLSKWFCSSTFSPNRAILCTFHFFQKKQLKIWGG